MAAKKTFRDRKEAARNKTIELFSLGYTPPEIVKMLKPEPRRNIYRWISEGEAQEPTLIAAHEIEAKTKTIGEPVNVGERREQVTMLREDQPGRSLHVMRGVYAATGDPSTWERQLFRQQVLQGDYIEPDFNFSLL